MRLNEKDLGLFLVSAMWRRRRPCQIPNCVRLKEHLFNWKLDQLEIGLISICGSIFISCRYKTFCCLPTSCSCQAMFQLYMLHDSHSFKCTATTHKIKEVERLFYSPTAIWALGSFYKKLIDDPCLALELEPSMPRILSQPSEFPKGFLGEYLFPKNIFLGLKKSPGESLYPDDLGKPRENSAWISG